ncbi:MAG: leucyl aminopeptidase [Spirochaetia bacterium]|nr:leucyl aminopeptidase [Spirochaetia bacterium]
MAKKKENSKNNDKKWLEYPIHNLSFQVSDLVKKDGFKIQFIFSSEENEKSKEKKPILKELPHFKAAAAEIAQSPGIFYIGLGSQKEIDDNSLGDTFLKTAQKVTGAYESAQISFPDEIYDIFSIAQITNLLITAFGVSSYSVDLLKKKPSSENNKLKEIVIIAEKKNHSEYQKQTDKYLKLINHINGMRQIQALPGNYLNPETMEERTRQMAKQYGLSIKVFDEAQLKKMGAGGILAVCQGSVQKPRMIVLEYVPKAASKDTPVVAFVGKGVTFDSGGISIKPSSDMHEMKMDMSGAAAVIHAVAAASELKLKTRVIGAVGVVENMPSGSAFKPGDVYKSLKGLTIEVQNTDAEGRLVLGDVLTHVEKEYKPDMILDVATLTGSCMIALGTYYAGLFSYHDKAISVIENSSKKSLEPVWRLPMSRLFTEELKSDIADHNNIGGRYGGASSAACFLSLFLEKETVWAHLDVAGVDILKSGYNVYSKEATGYGVRLLAQIAEDMSSN